jgi:hypothetical protein
MKVVAWWIRTFTKSGLPKDFITFKESEMTFYRDEWIGKLEIRELSTDETKMVSVENTP